VNVKLEVIDGRIMCQLVSAEFYSSMGM